MNRLFYFVLFGFCLGLFLPIQAQKRVSAQSPALALRVMPDQIAPTVYVVKPKLNSRQPIKAYRSKLTIQGYVRDESAIAQFSINGQVIPLAPDQTFKAEVSLQEGENLLIFEMTDVKGNLGREAFPVLRQSDTAPPRVTLSPRLDPNQPYRTNAARFSLAGMIQDVSTVQALRVNGEPVALQADSSFQVAIPLRKGVNALLIEAEDEAGNPFKAQYEVLMDENAADVTKPEITLIEPELEAIRGASGKVLAATDSLTVKGVVTDDSGQVTVLLNSNPIKLQANGYFRTRIALAEGENTLVIFAEDAAGNRAQAAFLAERPKQVQGRTGRDYALLIATDTYDEWKPLANPTRDVNALEETLRNQYGFVTETIKNPSREELLRKIRTYIQKSFGEGDQLFIFIAGHGAFDELEQSGYIVTKDSKLNDEVRSTYIAQSYLRETIEKIPAKHIFVAMDVCFGGTFDPSLATADRGEATPKTTDQAAFIQRELQFKTRQFITSGGKEYVSDGKNGEHSPFAGKLLESFKHYATAGDILTVPKLYGYLESLQPKPVWGSFGSNQVRSNFLFIPVR